MTSGLVAMKRAPRADQPDGPGDRLERVRAGLAEDDVVRVGVGERVAGLVQRRGQPGLADDVGGAAGQLVGRKSAVASAEVQMDSSGTCSPARTSRAARSRGVKIELLVSTRKRRCLLDQPLQELRGAGQRLVLVHQHAVHVGQPALGLRALGRHRSLRSAGEVGQGVVGEAEDRPLVHRARRRRPCRSRSTGCSSRAPTTPAASSRARRRPRPACAAAPCPGRRRGAAAGRRGPRGRCRACRARWRS